MNRKLAWALLLPLALASTVAMAQHGGGRGHFGGGGWGPSHAGHIVSIPRPVYRPHYNVGLSIGYGVGYGVGYGFGPYPWYTGFPYTGVYPYYSSPVVIEHNTVYEQPSVSSDTVTTYDNVVPTRSLLKDLQGRCYERTYANGRETRLELDPSECNF